jgi:hypothetical protein
MTYWKNGNAKNNLHFLLKKRWRDQRCKRQKKKWSDERHDVPYKGEKQYWTVT